MNAGAASVREVARRAGVALGTVSNVLNRPEKVSPETRQRVQQAIDELGFVRNDAARQLRNGRSRTIGMITPDASNPFFAEMILGAEDEAQRRGLAILNGNSRHDEERERGYLNMFQEQRTRGIIVSPVADDVDGWSRLRAPIVLTEQDATGHGLSSVSVANIAGARAAVEHLRSAGCRRILVAAGAERIHQVAERLAGARETDPGARIASGGLDVAAGVRLAEEILALGPEERPDGLFCLNDLIAIGLTRTLAIDGRLRIPEDLAVVGYDDIDFAAAAAVPLTSVRQPARLLGATAVELLVEQLAAAERHEPFTPRNIVFEPELIVRRSTHR